MELVRRMYDAFRRGDPDATLAFFDADVVVDASHRVDGRIGYGRDELAAIFGEWRGTWDDWSEEVHEIRAVGATRVLVISTQRGRGKGSGVQWERGFGMVYEIQGDKIGSWTIYDDPAAALDAAGVSE